MAINLKKGQKINLSKDIAKISPSVAGTSKGSSKLSKVIVGLGWDEQIIKKPTQPKKKGGLLYTLFGISNDDEELQKNDNIDCDAFALLLVNGKLTSQDDIVYFANLKHKKFPVIHMGDNLTGAGEGDDEQIVIDLSAIPNNYQIVIAVNIFHSKQRHQHFGVIENAFIRIVDGSTNKEMCRYSLSGKEYDGMTSMIFGKLHCEQGEWQFTAIGEATQDKSVHEVAMRY